MCVCGAASRGLRPPQPGLTLAAGLQSVTLHTDVGDIKMEVFCDQVPKAAENFLALCASGYYNGCLIHR